MSLSTKILIILGAILTFGALSFIIYSQVQISKRQTAIETSVVAQKTLIDGIVRSQSTWATKDDVNQFIKDNNINLKAIQDDMAKLHAEVTAVNVVVTASLAQHGTNIPSTGTGQVNPNPVPTTCPDGTPCPNADPYGYQVKTQLLSLNENFGSIQVPFGSVGFSAWKPAPWSIDIKAREYKSSSVVGTDENQRMYFYNKFSVTVDGKSYDLPIKTATTEQVYPDPKFSWWNPRLFMGADGGVNISQFKGEVTPSINVGIMSYGRYKTQPDFSVLQVGIGYGIVSQKPQVIFTPVAYNVGKHIPLMNNTYIGPSIHVGTDGSFSVMASIRIGL